MVRFELLIELGECVLIVHLLHFGPMVKLQFPISPCWIVKLVELPRIYFLILVLDGLQDLNDFLPG